MRLGIRLESHSQSVTITTPTQFSASSLESSYGKERTFPPDWVMLGMLTNKYPIGDH